MKSLVLAITLIFGLSITTNAQLPKAWMGHYSGDLNVTSVNGKDAVYHMEFELSQLNDSTYNWIIIYGEDSLRQERKYLLYDKGENQFVVDEQNGILLPCNRFANRFISVFEVQGNLIHAIYTFEKKKLIFELTSSTNKSETGNIIVDEEQTIPLVFSYETTTSQKATLKKGKQMKK